eukprot:scaffold117574_cov32-Tisochrysis_lutea.AAC.4
MVIGMPFTQSNPSDMFTARRPIRHVSTSTTAASSSIGLPAAAAWSVAKTNSSTSEYKLGSSADHNAGSPSTVPPCARTGPPERDRRPCASSA